jgi:hypothetical protein
MLSCYSTSSQDYWKDLKPMAVYYIYNFSNVDAHSGVLLYHYGMKEF